MILTDENFELDEGEKGWGSSIKMLADRVLQPTTTLGILYLLKWQIMLKKWEKLLRLGSIERMLGGFTRYAWKSLGMVRRSLV